MTYTLRTATTTDAALIADISRQTFYDTFVADNKPEDMEKFLAEQFTREALMMEVGLAENHFVLALDGEQVAGYLKLRTGRKQEGIDGSSLEIARIYVTKPYIGKGVGKVLMQSGLDEAARRGLSTVWLGVWEHNHHAINFYKAWGFEKFGVCDFILGNDLQHDWLMKRSVG